MSIGEFYWSFSILAISAVLILLEKRKDIKSFFLTTKVNLLDKYLICGIYALLMLIFVKDIFIEDVEKRFHSSLLILGMMVISGLILKRTLIKNLFKKRKVTKIGHEKFKDAKLNKVKLLNIKIRYVIMVIFASLILIVFLDSHYETLHGLYWTVSILAIMFILFAIYEYKKRSIKKQ